jgi:hypothetical protein
MNIMASPGPWLALISAHLLFLSASGVSGGRLMLLAVMLLGYCVLRIGDRLPVIVRVIATGDVRVPDTGEMALQRWVGSLSAISIYLVVMTCLCASTPGRGAQISVWLVALAAGFADAWMARIWDNHIVERELGW